MMKESSSGPAATRRSGIGCLALLLLATAALAAGGPESPAPSPRASPYQEPWHSEQARAAFAQGQELEDKGSYSFAVDRYVAALALEAHPLLHLHLGLCFDALGRNELAADSFARCLAARPKDVQVANRLGCVRLKLEQFDQAIAVFKALSTLDRDMGSRALRTAFIARGQHQLDHGAHEAAYRSFLEAGRLGGQDPRVSAGIHDSLAKLVAQCKTPEQAGKRLEALLLLYRHGQRDHLRDAAKQAFVEAGRPKALVEQVRALLKDPATR